LKSDVFNRHTFRPVADEKIAEIVKHIECEKLHLERLSASSSAAVEASVTDGGSGLQPVAADDPWVVPVTQHQPIEGLHTAFF